MLTVEGLRVAYGKALVIAGLDLAVAPGEVVALLGRNGAGKSTVLKALMGLQPAAGGTVRLDGAEITRWPSHRIARAGIGYVPEDRRVFSALTVLENLEVGRQPPRAGTPAWTEAALLELFPNLAERAGARARALSGGEQQMLAVARTLMGQPRLLLLDEPSEGLAPVIVEAMAEAVQRLKAAGIGVLLSEQNLRFARGVADRAVILDHGAAQFTGSFAELDANPELARAYLAV